MAREIVEPITTQEDGPSGDRTKTTHPAFAQVAARRVSGRTALYGSDFEHNAYMTITIRRSVLNRDLSRDWHFATDHLIEVALSEAQWATFVSAPNVGEGVPCTLEFLPGQLTPGLPKPAARHDQFGDEMKTAMAQVDERIRAVIEQIDGLNLPKKKAEALKRELGVASSHLRGNIDFVAKSFDEHMKATVEKAKVEVHGYMTDALMRAGVNALSGQLPPLRLGHDDGTPEAEV